MIEKKEDKNKNGEDKNENGDTALMKVFKSNPGVVKRFLICQDPILLN